MALRSSFDFALKVALALACLMWPLVSRALPVAHYKEDFFFASKPEERFERHVIWPTRNVQEDSILGPYYLAAIGGQILDDAQGNGYLSGPSRAHYHKEVEEYRSGKWPCTFITRPGSFTAEMHFAFAHRWNEAPLPWETRFLGDDDGILPKKMESPESVALGGPFPFPAVTDSPEFNAPANRRMLLTLGLHRPAIVGERTELKFLFGAHPSLPLLRELFHASTQYGLHRYSFREPTKAAWEKYAAAVNEFSLREKLHKALNQESSVANPAISPTLKVYLEQHFFDRALQPHVLNSTLYAHVSGAPLGSSQLSAREIFFGQKLNAPDPVYSFLESGSVGTAGIRTDIHKATITYFESLVLRSLDNLESLKIHQAVYPCSSLIQAFALTWH